jgi:hypothetical protein
LLLATPYRNAIHLTFRSIKEDSMADRSAQPNGLAQSVAQGIQWIVRLLAIAAVIDCGVVGFRGGRIAILGTRLHGSLAHGLIWLFIAGGIGFGVFEVVALLLETATRPPSGSVAQPQKRQPQPMPPKRMQPQSSENH